LHFDSSRIAHALYRYRHFVISSGGALMNVATLQLPVLTLSVRFGIDTAGWLGLAQRVAAGPVNLLVTATGQVFMSRVVEPIRNGDRNGVAAMFRKLVGLQSCVALVCAPLLLLAPAAFALVFGEQWRESGSIVQILGVALVAQFVFSPGYGLLSLLERQGLYFLVEFTRLLLLGAALLISSRQQAPLHPTLVYIAVASAGGYLVAAAATYQGIRQMAPNAAQESRHR
jgi:O-antigen/teichoic acid export membrane protein